jgi:protein transport protein SEC23
MDVFETEEKNCLRHSWNVLPGSRIEASKIILPVGALITPLREIPDLQVLNYNPVVCSHCHGILNPCCRVDFMNKMWVCPLCQTVNKFPMSYMGISEQALPAELYPQYTTVEYRLNKPNAPPPVFLYVIDTCLPEDELTILKDSIQMSFNLLPENAIIGLITFGTTVQVYELGYSECSKAFVFRGDKAPTFDQVQDQLGLRPNFAAQKVVSTGNISMNNPMKPQQQNSPSSLVQSRFLLPLSECEINLTSIVEELQCDPWPVKSNRRSKRCTGVALSIAVSLLECSFSGFGARILTFIGGPCTLGEGTVVGLDLKEQIRLHNDLRAGKAPHFKAATQFFNGLTQRLIQNGHVVDIFAANLDQVGALEMKSCCENTGGYLILTDTFDNPIYKESLKRFFKMGAPTGEDQISHLQMAFNATLEVQCSPEIKICGAIGPITSMNTKSHHVSEVELGYGQTNAWKINALNPNTTIAIYYDIVNQQANPGNTNFRYFQYVTAYQHASGQYRLRVTTQALPWVQPGQWLEIAQGFDQQAAAVLVSRLSVFKAETEYLFDVLRWLDRSLIKWVAKFGQYSQNNPDSLALAPHMSMYPQFMYHLRRSQFLRVFNSSPDETTFFRLLLNRENTNNSIIMIQPTLHCYSFNAPPHPVPLDSLSVKSDVILLLDTFFCVLIHYGETIAQWRDAGYADQPKFENFKKLLELPKADAEELIKDRFPYPRYLECDEGGSQARFLIAKINPSTTHHNQAYGDGQATVVLTDDASMQTFMQSLKKLAVSPQ